MEITENKNEPIENPVENIEREPSSVVRKHTTRDTIAAMLIVGLLAGGASGYQAAKYEVSHQQRTSYTNLSNQPIAEDSAIIDVVKNSSPAVVSIIISKNLNLYQNDFNNPFLLDPFGTNNNNSNATPNYQVTGAGSGFFVTADGLILTNKHVVQDSQAKYTVLTNDGNKYDAEVVAQDPVNDLALVKVNISNAPTVKFADSSKIEIGQRVVAIGNSLGQYRNTVTSGIVSGIGRNITAGDLDTAEQLEGVIQTDAAINPGNSGGPLLNIFGDVIGVNTAVDQQGQLVGFAIPSNDARNDIDSYIKNKKITKPFLGVRYVLLTPAIKDEQKLPLDYGAWITSKGGQNSDPAVVSGSAADKAGIKDGDIIVAVNDQKIDQNTSLSALLKNYNAGDTVNLEVYRDGKTIKLPVQLGETK